MFRTSARLIGHRNFFGSVVAKWLCLKVSTDARVYNGHDAKLKNKKKKKKISYVIAECIALNTPHKQQCKWERESEREKKGETLRVKTQIVWNRHLSKFVIPAFIRVFFVNFVSACMHHISLKAEETEYSLKISWRFCCRRCCWCCCWCWWYGWCRELNPQFVQLFFYSLTVDKMLLNHTVHVCIEYIKSTSPMNLK